MENATLSAFEPACAVLGAAALISGRRGTAWRRRRHLARPGGSQSQSAVNSRGRRPPAVSGGRRRSARVLPGGRDSYADVVKAVAPAVVTIRVEGKARVVADAVRRRTTTCFAASSATTSATARRPTRQRAVPRTFKQRGLGSGVVVSERRLHPDQQPRRSTAPTTSASSSPTAARSKAKLVGTDKPSDLALVKIDGDQSADRAARQLRRGRSATSCSRSATRSASARP